METNQDYFMRKLVTIFFFISFFSYSQIDYKKLVKHLDTITVKTELKTFFNDIPFKASGDEIKLTDERFLRYYNVIVDKVIFDNGWYGKRMQITLFDNIEDYRIIKTKLTELHGDATSENNSSSITHTWETDTQIIVLEVETEDNVFKEFEELTIKYKQ